MTNLIKKFSLLDWFVSLACLGYGIATQDWLWIGGGTLGLVIAYFKPAERFKTKLESKLLASKKKTVAVVAMANKLARIIWAVLTKEQNYAAHAA